ncbi:acyltransferase family protein [Psychrobacillus glaciei]|uniref:acyltransferase family protein n=1 Tax=Psychrobacillus glaciei TaxID=2283160 RepID=UPI00178C21F8|nr:acyltransferase [Psychrobacillus glaciei]
MGKYVNFGAWRFFLAFLVVISHLWADMIHGPAAYAVWGFYVLSGYLMTYVLRNKYGFNKEGLISYAFNRFLRIMPLYYVALILGIVTLYFISKGDILQSLNGQFAFPQGTGWLFALTLLPIFPVGNTLVPVSNALGIEVGAYFLLPLIAMNRSTAWITVIIGVFINSNHGFDLLTFETRYATFLPCILSFAIGSLVCHYKDELKKFAFPTLSIVIWLIHALLWLKFPYWPWTYGLYISMILSAWVVISIDSRETSKFDKTLGDFSYPIYLIHTTVGAWFYEYFNFERSFEFFVVSFSVTLIVSWLLVKVIDKPLYSIKKPGILLPNTFRVKSR